MRRPRGIRSTLAKKDVLVIYGGAGRRAAQGLALAGDGSAANIVWMGRQELDQKVDGRGRNFISMCN